MNDLDACILSLEDEVKRQAFQIDFRTFSRQMDVILPDSAATPFVGDLKRLGKISIGARNRYRGEQIRIKREIKHLVIENFDKFLVNPVIERFMELARQKFG